MPFVINGAIPSGAVGPSLVGLRFFSLFCAVMSKNALKKELALMTEDQLRQLILEAYEARKEIRAYLEYFLAPDPRKLYEKTKSALDRECRRGRRGICRARISVIRALIADFESYAPGDRYGRRLISDALGFLLDASASARMSDTLCRGFSRLVHEFIAAADRAGDVSGALDALGRLASSKRGKPDFRALVAKAVADGGRH